MLRQFTLSTRTAYFSMEIALGDEIPTYSGGLGVLAGDTLRSAADLELPLVGVTLVSRAGYFRQNLDKQGRQSEEPDWWEPEKWATPLEAKVAVTLEERTVWIAAWLYVVSGCEGGRIPVILLDTQLTENAEGDRTITHHLYGGDSAYRLKQEVVLGVGGVRMLQALGFQVGEYHMNEGHSALLAMELLARYAYPAEALRPGESLYNFHRVREMCNFTTHTPVEAGHDQFPYELVERVLGGLFPLEELKKLAGSERLNMTRLALNLSEYVNGVAKRHAEVSRRQFPGYRVHSITNGVHPGTWTHPAFAQLYHDYTPGWCLEPELLVRADQIPGEAIWQAHSLAKGELIQRVAERCRVELDPQRPLLGFARRMTGYKRPDLLFHDLARLRLIAARHPFQVVMAGKAHPNDGGGKWLIEQLHHFARELEMELPVAYLPGYEMGLAHTLVAGCDIWLNTPLPPFEASGTSGMKAAFNGVPSLSVLDGWWIEGCIEGVTGWAVGRDGRGEEPGPQVGDEHAADLYDKLERLVLPGYYQDSSQWIRIMKGAISKNAVLFNSHRMMRRYVAEAYLR
ncbi:MAG: alpha-glucan family phosphorylase [Candidatus Competibacteraceae bacterium]|nr:alpha-glucan family phosphorylase [Candidatus Competibacteraceae bacterium]